MKCCSSCLAVLAVCMLASTSAQSTVAGASSTASDLLQQATQGPLISNLVSSGLLEAIANTPVSGTTTIQDYFGLVEQQLSTLLQDAQQGITNVLATMPSSAPGATPFVQALSDPNGGLNLNATSLISNLTTLALDFVNPLLTRTATDSAGVGEAPVTASDGSSTDGTVDYADATAADGSVSAAAGQTAAVDAVCNLYTQYANNIFVQLLLGGGVPQWVTNSVGYACTQNAQGTLGNVNIGSLVGAAIAGPGTGTSTGTADSIGSSLNGYTASAANNALNGGVLGLISGGTQQGPLATYINGLTSAGSKGSTADSSSSGDSSANRAQGSFVNAYSGPPASGRKLAMAL